MQRRLPGKHRPGVAAPVVERPHPGTADNLPGNRPGECRPTGQPLKVFWLCEDASPLLAAEVGQFVDVIGTEREDLQ